MTHPKVSYHNFPVSREIRIGFVFFLGRDLRDINGVEFCLQTLRSGTLSIVFFKKI